MRWRGNRQSQNIDDLRGSRASKLSGSRGGAGLLRLLPMVYRFLGFKGTVVAVVGVIAYGLFSGNLEQILGISSMQNNNPQTLSKEIKQSAQEKQLVEFIAVILADTEDIWAKLFKQNGRQYQEPRLVLYRGSVNSGCGYGSAQMGPFYCPADKKVYLDLSFYDELENKYKSPGDFAQAYVLAHEIGHHVQNLLGTSTKVHQAKQKLNKLNANKLSVKLELQADCYAGIWAYQANQSRQILEPGDIQEGLQAASAIGDDQLQKQSQGRVNPDSFTHGSSEQRVKWFNIGLNQGTITACNTF